MKDKIIAFFRNIDFSKIKKGLSVASRKIFRKRRNRLIAYGIVIAFFLFILLSLVFGGNKVKLEKYVDVSFSGNSGSGNATLVIDRAAFAKDHPKKDINDYTISLDKSSGLSNGDTVTVTMEKKKKTFTVSGLREIIESLDQISDNQIAQIDAAVLEEVAKEYDGEKEVLGHAYYKNSIRTLVKTLVRSQEVYLLYELNGVEADLDNIVFSLGGYHGDSVMLIDGRVVNAYLDIDDALYEIESLNLTEEGKAIYADSVTLPDMTAVGQVKVLVDKLNIRSEASLQGTIRATTQSGRIYPVFEVTHADGYDWYRIGKNKFIASKEGDWTSYTATEASGN